MAIGKLDRAKESETRFGKRRLLKPSSRYDACRTVEESGSVRLSFKRYADFDAAALARAQKGAVMPGSESRADCMAEVAYGDRAMFWALVLFNRERLTDLDPQRFEVGAVLGIPSAAFVAKKFREEVIVDV